MNELKYRILCIEDDEDTCDLINFVFSQEAHQVKVCSQEDCLKLVHEEEFSAIILDNFFHGITGIEICREIRRTNQKVPIIFFSGESRRAEIEKAFAAGADAYLVKPDDFEKILTTTVKLIENSQSND